MSGNRKNNTLANRIKRMMQSDEDVGKISQQTPTVIGKASVSYEQPCVTCTMPSMLIKRTDVSTSTSNSRPSNIEAC